MWYRPQNMHFLSRIADSAAGVQYKTTPVCYTLTFTSLHAMMASTNDPDGVAICIREDGETLPLMIRPVEENNNSPEFLRNWIAQNKQWLDRKLLEHGARKYQFACIGHCIASYMRMHVQYTRR